MSIQAKVKELREQRAKLYADAHKLLDKPAAEITKEDRGKFDEMITQVDTLKADIVRFEKDLELDSEMRGTRRPPMDDPDHPLQDEDVVDPSTDPKAIARRKRSEVKFARAFNDYLRSNSDNPLSAESRKILQDARTAEEFRDMGITTGALGGYFVPQGFVFKIEEAMKWYGNMLVEADTMDTASGQPLPYPTDNDTTTTGEWVAEAQQVTEADVSVGHIIFGANKASSKMVKVSIELQQDSAFDIEGLLVRKFAERIGRLLNTGFTVGTGTNQPMGILTAAVANCGSPSATPTAYGTPLIASGSATNTGGAETGGVTFGSKDIVNLEATVDPAYRQGAKYMMHDLSLRFAKGLLDKYGRPLWQIGLAIKAPDTLNGYEVSINNDMPTLALSANTVIFGQLKKYTIRRVKEFGIVQLRERFADYGQVAYIGFGRYDGQLLDAGTHPVCYMQQAAS